MNLLSTTLEQLARETALLKKEIDRLKQRDVASFDWRSWSTTQTGLATSPAPVVACRYAMMGKLCIFNVYVSGTSNSTAFQITLPFTSMNVTNVSWTGVIGNIWDNGTAQTTAGRWFITANSNVMSFRRDMVQLLWTASGTKTVRTEGFYEIA